MSGYDGPSYYKYMNEEEKQPFKKHDSVLKATQNSKKHSLPETQGIQKKPSTARSSTPFRFQSVPSSYFKLRRPKEKREINYSLLKKEFAKKSKDFLLFEAFLSEEAIGMLSEDNEKRIHISKEKIENNRTVLNKNPSSSIKRKRLSRSLAGIIEAEEAHADRKSSMTSLFSDYKKM